jgi:hypothetical protein
MTCCCCSCEYLAKAPQHNIGAQREEEKTILNKELTKKVAEKEYKKGYKIKQFLYMSQPAFPKAFLIIGCFLQGFSVLKLPVRQEFRKGL